MSETTATGVVTYLEGRGVRENIAKADKKLPPTKWFVPFGLSGKSRSTRTVFLRACCSPPRGTVMYMLPK